MILSKNRHPFLGICSGKEDPVPVYFAAAVCLTDAVAGCRTGVSQPARALSRPRTTARRRPTAGASLADAPAADREAVDREHRLHLVAAAQKKASSAT